MKKLVLPQDSPRREKMNLFLAEKSLGTSL